MDRNLAETKSKAQSMIMAGQVYVDDKIITKSGNSFNKKSKIKIKQLHPTWVSRGAFKLLKAIDHFKIDIENKICLDIGSSTGGFTEVLLKKNAKKIYSVDVGTNQLHEKLKKEKNIISIENINAKYINNAAAPSIIKPSELRLALSLIADMTCAIKYTAIGGPPIPVAPFVTLENAPIRNDSEFALFP